MTTNEEVLPAAKGFVVVVVFWVWFLCLVFVWFVCLLAFFGCLFLASLCFFACLSSFTDWCTAHRQQFREQKKKRRLSHPCVCAQCMLLPGVNLSIGHLLPSRWEIMPGVPSAMLTPSDAVFNVAAMVKVGKTLDGSQLLNIADLPAVHYPVVLGIPRQMPCAPFTVERQNAIIDSLFILLKLFVTQNCSFLHEATQDAEHLISTVAAICGCLATGESSLDLAILSTGKPQACHLLSVACSDHTKSGSSRESCRTGKRAKWASWLKWNWGGGSLG